MMKRDSLDNIYNKREEYQIVEGIKLSAPILLGYIPVGFAFGVVAAKGGIAAWVAVLISLSNFTSAGQFAGANLIISNAPIFEIGLTTFIINIRYILMSLSLTQKIKPGMSLGKRLILAFGITDEIFTLASLQNKEMTFKYMLGLIAAPYFGWAFGTFLGAASTTFLSETVQSSMGIALYAMFIALIIPESKKSKAAAVVVSIAVVCSSIFKWTPYLSQLSSGYVIIICTVAAAGIGAFLFPREDDVL